MASKKISFTKDGVKYTDIEVYEYLNYKKEVEYYSVGVTDTTKMIRQELDQKYNIKGRDVVWVKSAKFANGNSIDVYLNNAPEDFAKKIGDELYVKYCGGKSNIQDDSYSYTGGSATTDDGIRVRFGTKFFSLANKPPYGSNPSTTPDWNKIMSGSKPTKPKPSGGSAATVKPSADPGQLIKVCAGWDFYKKQLPDGRIVYNIRIQKETAPNKKDWDAIKSAVYSQTGFKWGRFGAFEKWGTIASEAMVMTQICNILSMYYNPANTPTVTTTSNSVSPEVELIGDYLIDFKDNFFKKEKLISATDLYEREDKQDKFNLNLMRDKNVPTWLGAGYGVYFWVDVYDYLDKQSSPLLQNFLSLKGVLGDGKQETYIRRWESDNNLYLNPIYFLPSKKSKSEIVADADKLINFFEDWKKENGILSSGGDSIFEEVNQVSLANSLRELLEESALADNYNYDDLLLLNNELYERNYYTLLNALGLLNFYGKEIRDAYIVSYEKNGPNSFLNPKFFEKDSGGVSMAEYLNVVKQLEDFSQKTIFIIEGDLNIYDYPELQKSYCRNMYDFIVTKIGLQKYSLDDWDTIKGLLSSNKEDLIINFLGLMGLLGKSVKEQYINSYKKEVERDAPTIWFLNPEYFGINIDGDSDSGSAITTEQRKEVEDAIKGLRILADSGDEEAKKVMNTLKKLL